MRLADSETYSKTRISILLALLAALVFWQLLLGLYNQYVVAPVLSRVTCSRVADIAIGLLDAAIILFFIAKIRAAYRLSDWQRAILCIPGLLYLGGLHYAGIEPVPNWRFHVFQCNSRFRYADTLLLLLAGGITLTVYAAWRRLTIAKSSASYLREDIPLAHPNDDTLNRQPEARRVAQQITSLAPSASVRFPKSSASCE